MGDLVLNKEDHIYTFDGSIVPGVTTILADCGLIDATYFNELAAWRGSMVHLACQLDCDDDLIEDTLDPGLVPYLSAWKAFKTETGWVSQLIETPLYSNLYGFAGTPDRIGMFLP